jgi:transcriptional regulator with XRE-family HTH domain
MKPVEPFYVELGRRIQKRRSAQGMSQEALGRELKPPVTRASIANIESGQQRVLAHTLVQLAKALEVELMELIPPPHQDGQQSPAKEVEAELAEKLQLPKKQIKELTARITGSGHRRKQ